MMYLQSLQRIVLRIIYVLQWSSAAESTERLVVFFFLPISPLICQSATSLLYRNIIIVLLATDGT